MQIHSLSLLFLSHLLFQSLNAFQVMMHTTSRYGNARFKNIDIERIQHELDSHKIVVVTGFQTVVPSTLFKLERTINGTSYFFAISTERL